MRTKNVRSRKAMVIIDRINEKTDQALLFTKIISNEHTNTIVYKVGKLPKIDHEVGLCNR